MRIHKYPLKVADHQEIDMPLGARILCVQVQGGIPCLWAEVSPESAPESRLIVTYGLGNPMGSHAAYVGTYQLDGGSLTFHVYEGEA